MAEKSRIGMGDREISFSMELSTEDTDVDALATVLDCSTVYDMDGEFIGFGPKVEFNHAN